MHKWRALLENVTHPIKNVKMAEKHGFPAGHENNEYLLSSLDDETPSSSEDSVQSQKLTVGAENVGETDQDFGKVSVDRIAAIRAEVELIKVVLVPPIRQN